MNNRILAVDVGFVATGLALMERTNGRWLANHLKSSRPQSGPKKKCGLRVADSDAEHIGKMSLDIIEMAKLGAGGLLVELPNGGAQSGRAMRCMGLAAGMIAAIAEALALPVEWYTPRQTREAACGRMAASKTEVMTAMAQRWAAYDPLKYAKLDAEAIADALATFEAARTGNLVRGIERNGV